jgi:hypothetical protein
MSIRQLEVPVPVLRSHFLAKSSDLVANPGPEWMVTVIWLEEPLAADSGS